MRVHARELAEADEDADEALGRALSGWLSLTEHAEQRLPDTPLSVHESAPRPWSAPTTLIERLLGDAVPWFSAEQPALICAVEQACRHGMTTLAWELTANLHAYFTLMSQWGPWRHTSEVTLAACRLAGDRRGEATMLLGLGALTSHTSHEGLVAYQHAVALFRETGDGSGEARALSELSTAYHTMMRFHDALVAADRALILARRHRLRGIETDAHLSRAQALLDMDRVGDAISANLSALDLLQGQGARRMEAQALSQLARARRAAGDLEAAAELLEASLRITRDLGDLFGEAYVSIAYAEVQTAREQHAEAEAALVASLNLSRALGAPSLEGFASFTLGNLYRAQGRPALADKCFGRAAELWDEVGNAKRATEARAAQVASAGTLGSGPPARCDHRRHSAPPAPAEPPAETPCRARGSLPAFHLSA